jgi:LPS export ABC transporter protein LptC
MNYRIIFLPLLLILASFVAYQHMLNKQNMEQRSRQTKTDSVDFFVLNSTTVKLHGDGRLHYSFRSERIESFDADQTRIASRPDLEITSDDGSVWFITALTATIFADDNRIRLDKNVIIQQPEKNLRLTTDSITIFPDQELAETSHPVKIFDNYGVTTSTGARADFNKDLLFLLDEVRSNYVVN